MLKYTTAVGNEDGIVSPTHHPEFTRTLDLSAGSKGTSKMAIKRREGVKKILSRDRNPEGSHLPPITQGGSPQNMTINSNLSNERKENYPYLNQSLKRKDIRTPYVSHVQRISDVATPYVLHTQITNIEAPPTVARENSKLSKYSGNIVEYKHEPELRHEPTFSSLQKLPTSSSPVNEKRPRGRHGRKSNSFNENDLGGHADIKELTVQSNQMGLYKRADKKQRDLSKGKTNESFSIRKKIEQFRRWHEEQYKEKIKKLKQEVDHQFEAEHNRISRQVGVFRETPTSKNDMSVTLEVEKVPSEVSQEKMDQDKSTPNPLSLTTETSKPRSGSARTWKTWRNVNDSYAYNDVQKYIQENELMDDEKALWIKKWIIEVNKAMKEQHHESIL